MSATLGWCFLAGYVVLGIGTSRVVFARQYAKHYPYWVAKVADRYSSWYEGDPDAECAWDGDVLVPTISAFVVWPLALAYLLVLRPLGTVVVPGFAAWFAAPARARAARASAGTSAGARS